MSNTKRHKLAGKFKAERRAGESPAWPMPLRRHKKNGSPIATCNCPLCQEGRKRGWGKTIIARAIAAHKRNVKAALRQGDWERVEEKIWVPYTD